MFYYIVFLFFKLTLLVFLDEMHYVFPKKKVLNAILNDTSKEEIRRISTVVVIGKHLVSHISNFHH